MRIEKSPEIHIKANFLEERTDIINRVIYLDGNFIDVEMDHPVLGSVLEVYQKNGEYLTLKTVLLLEMTDWDEVEIAQDYYNNFLLGGRSAYLSYFNPEVGFYLSTRNL
jgi:hypothetical protein